MVKNACTEDQCKYRSRTHLIIYSSLLRVSQNVIGFIDLLELFFVTACRHQHEKMRMPAFFLFTQ